MTNQKGYRRAAIIFLVIWLAFVFVPLITMVVWAFTDSWPFPDLLPQNFTLRGFEKAATIAGTDLVSLTVFSVLVAVAISVLSVVVATLTARAISFHRFPGRNIWRFAVILPFIIPSSAFAMGVQSVFTRMGLSGTVLGVILAVTIIVMPYAISIMIDVMDAAGNKLEEQAAVLGASKWQIVRDAIIPSILPGLLSAASLSYIVAFMQYFIVFLVGIGSVKTLAVVMFPFLAGADRTVGAVFSLIFVGVSFCVFLLFNFILKKCGIKEEVQLYH